MGSAKEITKPEKTSLSDFKLHTIVCAVSDGTAAAGGMSESEKESIPGKCAAEGVIKC